MILACQKLLGQITKVLGFGEIPLPPVWEKLPKNPVFFSDRLPKHFIVRITVIRASLTTISVVPYLSGTSTGGTARGPGQVWLGQQHHARASSHLLRGPEQFQLVSRSPGGGQGPASVHSSTLPDWIHTDEATWHVHSCPGASWKGGSSLANRLLMRFVRSALYLGAGARPS